MTTKIKVIDYIMGSGKTRHIFKWMLENPDNRYIYVTPLLSEAEDRAANELAPLDVKIPCAEDGGSKSAAILKLLMDGENIATTHSLFLLLSPAHVAAFQDKNYTIIMDEAVDFIEPYSGLRSVDIKTAFESGHAVPDFDNRGRVSWTWDVPELHHFRQMRDLCDLGSLYITKGNRMMLNTQIPPVILEKAKDVYVLTYKYKSSNMCAFMKMFGFDYELVDIPELVQREKEVKDSLRENIELVELPNITKVASKAGFYVMSHSWWGNASKEDDQAKVMSVVGNYIYNNKLQDKFFFTCPKDVVEGRNSLCAKHKPRCLVNSTSSVNGALPKWLYSGTKATNLYSNKTICFYLSNVFQNVSVAAYLKDYEIAVEVDEYALSEMLQFIWRGCIRKGEKMQLVIAAPRMRALFEKWLNE